MTKEEQNIFPNEKVRDDFAKMLCDKVKKAFKDLSFAPALEEK